jgi:DNA-binding CsgD family transcriptional regulator
VELCRAGLDSVTFRQQLRAVLARLVPFDGYCVNTVDPESRLITSSIGDGLSASAARRLFELEDAGTDVNRLQSLARGPVHVATVWQVTGGQVERSQRMRELFLPLGWADELRAALVVDGHCWGYLQLFRAAARAPFSAQDVSQVEQLRALLGAALRAACVVGVPNVVRRAPAVLLLDEQGALLAQSETTRGWLQGFASDVGQPLPHPVHVVSARARTQSSVSARYREPGGSWLTFNGAALGAEVAVLLGSTPGRELLPLLLLAHGLTARERAVGSLLLDGCSNQDIADMLSISLYTTKDHVKAIFRKCGAASRAELSARLAF